MKVGNFIMINKREYRLFGAPLDQYWQMKSSKPAFAFSSSPLDIGYGALWNLENDILYLTEFSGQLMWTWKKVSLESQFPDKSPPILADWYTGTLKVQTGKVSRVNLHFGSLHEYEIVMSYKNGKLINIYINDIL